jgi:hypothetical protein
MNHISVSTKNLKQPQPHVIAGYLVLCPHRKRKEKNETNDNLETIFGIHGYLLNSWRHDCNIYDILRKKEAKWNHRIGIGMTIDVRSRTCSSVGTHLEREARLEGCS